MRVDFPKVDPVAESGPENYILSLYRSLGWNGESKLDPKKILLNPEHWQDICNEFNRSSDGVTAGLAWMNYGPSSNANIPYGKVEIEEGAFELNSPSLLTDEIKQSINENVSYTFDVEGKTAYLIADQNETNGFLLQSAYDARNLTPEAFLQTLHEVVDENWTESIDLVIDEVLERAGIIPYTDERYEEARDYLVENYEFKPPYSHYLDQSMKVNIMLGTEKEKDLDFVSITDTEPALRNPEFFDEGTLDNGLIWLVKQQGHTLDELKDALQNYEKWGFDAVEITHGTFLASVAEELNNFTNVMGSVTVLADMSMHDMAKMMSKDATITLPQNATIGIFAPWVGGGSVLDIQLERDLVIPENMRFDLQIEGADCNEYTVNNVYGLIDHAWKQPLDITSPIQEKERPLEGLLKEAKERAAEKNNHLIPAEKEHKSPEIER